MCLCKFVTNSSSNVRSYVYAFVSEGNLNQKGVKLIYDSIVLFYDVLELFLNERSTTAFVKRWCSVF